MTSLQRDARVQEIEQRMQSTMVYEEGQSYHDLRFLLDQVAALQADADRLTKERDDIRERAALHWIQSVCPHGAAYPGKCLTCVTASLVEASEDFVRLSDRLDAVREGQVWQ